MGAPIEYRFCPEMRQSERSDGFSGYASTNWTVDSYYSAIKDGAARKTLRERGDRIPVLLNHDTALNIGVPETLKEDKKGLYSDARLFDDGAEGTVTLKRLRQGARYGLSIGFQTIKDRAGTKDDPFDFSFVKAKPEDIRVIEEYRLFEFSVVSFPANENATINDVRAANEAAALSTLIERIKRGDLTPDQRALAEQLVAAFSDAEPEPDPSTPLVAAPDARRRTIDITLALATAQGWIGATA